MCSATLTSSSNSRAGNNTENTCSYIEIIYLNATHTSTHDGNVAPNDREICVCFRDQICSDVSIRLSPVSVTGDESWAHTDAPATVFYEECFTFMEACEQKDLTERLYLPLSRVSLSWRVTVEVPPVSFYPFLGFKNHQSVIILFLTLVWLTLTCHGVFTYHVKEKAAVGGENTWKISQISNLFCSSGSPKDPQQNAEVMQMILVTQYRFTTSGESPVMKSTCCVGHRLSCWGCRSVSCTHI